MGSAKHWTDQEKQFLEDNWGTMAVPGIAKKLGRPKGGVINMARRLGLGRFTEAGELVSYNTVLVALYGPHSGSYSKYRLERLGLPIKYKRNNKNRFAMVNMDDFWKWAKENQSLLNFKNFKEYELGPEPEWAKEKRKRDCETCFAERRNHNDPWTPQEDRKLQRMIDANKYTYSDIAREMRRSEGAVKRRIVTAGITGKPVRNPKKTWTSEEVEQLLQMVEQGFDWKHIADELGRSQLCVRGKYERLLNPEYMKRRHRGKDTKENYVHIREITPSEVRTNMSLANTPPR